MNANETNANNFFRVYSLRIRIALRDRGFEPLYEEDNIYKPGLKCWVYQNTSEFYKTFSEVMDKFCDTKGKGKKAKSFFVANKEVKFRDQEMEEDITFIVHKEWLDNINTLDIDMQDKVIADIIRYGVKLPAQHEDDPDIVSFVNMLKGRIDYSKLKYEQKKQGGLNNGRKKQADDAEIYRLANEGKKNSAEIAEILGVSKSTVDHNIGWKKRNEDGFVF